MTRFALLTVAVILSLNTCIQAQASVLQSVFTGNLNPCIDGMCLNGGTCIAPIDYPQCVCAPGFQGTLCETFVGTLNPCREGLCQNGGTCTAFDDYPQCLCAPGFHGTFCEYSRDPCFNFTCFNGGRCRAPIDVPRCECRPGYTGDKCQTKIGEGKDGQCPTVRRGSVGVCAGDVCSVDSDCAKEQKCCKSACGRKRCTSVKISEPVDLASLCSLIDCAPDRYCRAALPCETCEPVATCVSISTIAGDIDKECQRQNYFQVLLMQSDNRPDTYTRLKCRGQLSTRDCPKGSVCVDVPRGGGVCCFGKPLVVERPGTCPTKQIGDLCVGTICETDDQCPNPQKCCSVSCGYNFCTDVVTDQLSCPGGCPKGYFCDYRPVPCPPGQFCIQIVIPTCVPLIADRCGGCPELQVCVVSDEPCFGFVCPKFVCVPNDECGGCLPGQMCETLYLSCPRPPPCDGVDGPPCGPYCEPIRNCVPIETTPAPTDACQGCPSGQECQFILPPCPPPPGCEGPDLSGCYRPYCAPVPRCVPTITTTPVPTDACQGCPSGQECQFIMPPCPPPPGCEGPDLSGCTRPFCVPVPRCVPAITTTPIPVDPCGGCGKGQVCIDTGLRCFNTPCPSHQCLTNNSCGGCQSCQQFSPGCLPPRYCDEPIDECGGCRSGQTCRFTGIVCIKAPCPSFACFDSDD